MKTKFIAKDRKYFEETAASVFRELEDCLNDYKGVISPNWHFMLHCVSNGDTYLSIEAYEGDGSDFAEAKMSTLKNFPHMVSVGVKNLGELKALLDDYYINKEVVELQEIFKIAELHPEAHPRGLLNANLWEWLRTQAQISPWGGGIRMPYSMIICNENGTSHVRGDSLSTFSGSNEHYDTVIVLRALRAFQDSLTITHKNTQHSYNLEELRKNAGINILIREYGLREKDRYTVV